MNYQFQLKGCISFDEIEFAISIPIFKERFSNQIFIPRTDAFFNVLDFYPIEEFGYPIQWLDPEQERIVKIGDKCPVPIIALDRVFLIDTRDTVDEIRAQNPELIEPALRAFVSLRSRARETASQLTESEWKENYGFPTELLEPVRSKYWISKFAAHIRSIHDHNAVTEDWSRTVIATRNEWFEKFAHKTQFRMVDQLLKLSELPVPEAEQNKIMIHRFDKIFKVRAFNLSSQEISGYEQRFPNGLIAAAQRLDDGATYKAWEMQSEYSQIIAHHCRRWKYRHVDGGDPVWNLSPLELTKVLRVVRLLARDDFHFTEAFYDLEQILEEGTNSLRTAIDTMFILSDSQLKRRALAKQIGSMFGQYSHHELIQKNEIPDRDLLEERFSEYYHRLLLLTQIVRPHLRNASISDIGIQDIQASRMSHRDLRRTLSITGY